MIIFFSNLQRYLRLVSRKARGAFRDPVRALRIIWNELAHKAVVYVLYRNQSSVTARIGEKDVIFCTDDLYSKQWFYPRFAQGKLHEPAVTEVIVALAPTLGSFTDVGAHLGYFATLAGVLMRGRPLLAYEMDDRAYDRMYKNLKANGISTIGVRHKAVSNKNGSVKYRRTLTIDAGENILKDNDSHDGTLVDSVTIDVALKDVPVGLIKIDVEGAEKDVLLGMPETFSKRPLILLEIHGEKLIAYGSTAEQVLSILESHEYCVYEISEHRTKKKAVLQTLISPKPAMVFAVPREQNETIKSLLLNSGVNFL